MVKNKDLIQFEKATGRKILEIVNNPAIIETLPIEPVLDLAEKIDPSVEDLGDAIGVVYAYFTELSLKAMKKVQEKLEKEGYGEVVKLVKMLENGEKPEV